MGPTLEHNASFADRVVDQLRGWPALNVCRVDCGASSGLAMNTHQIVHLHTSNEAELYLTWPVIQRMYKVLLASGQVIMEPNADWVRVRLGSDSDVRLLLSLVSVAIQANAPAISGHRQASPCPKATLKAV